MTVSDDKLVRIIRTAPRSTSAQIVSYVQEDLGVTVTQQTLRAQLNRLYDAGVLGRHDRRLNYPTLRHAHYTWWVA